MTLAETTYEHIVVDEDRGHDPQEPDDHRLGAVADPLFTALGGVRHGENLDRWQALGNRVDA